MRSIYLSVVVHLNLNLQQSATAHNSLAAMATARSAMGRSHQPAPGPARREGEDVDMDQQSDFEQRCFAPGAALQSSQHIAITLQALKAPAPAAQKERPSTMALLF